MENDDTWTAADEMDMRVDEISQRLKDGELPREPPVYRSEAEYYGEYSSPRLHPLFQEILDGFTKR